jgi:beta-phosphoglucomutase-like phosphatase (HAD superfamily)
MKKYRFDDAFDYILAKESVTRKKPDPEVYLKALSTIGEKADDCIVIEDSYSGCLAAINAGIEVINIYDRHSDSERELIDSLVDYKYGNYDELTEVFR